MGCGGGGIGGGCLFKAGHLLTFSAFRMGAYLRWALAYSNKYGTCKPYSGHISAVTNINFKWKTKNFSNLTICS